MPLFDEYLLAAGDQRILLDDGTYTIGRATLSNPFSVTRPPTTGPFKGWLEVKARNKHGVVLNLDPAISNGLFLDSPNSARLRLMGIEIINGVMEPRQPDIDLWHCRNEYMGATWSAQGNYRTITISTTAGSNIATRTAGASFTAADVGKYLQSDAAGLGGSNKAAPAISQVLDGNRAQLSYAATSTGTGRTAYVGTSPAAGYYGNCIPILSTASQTKRFRLFGGDVKTSGDAVQFANCDDIHIEGSILDSDSNVPFDPTDIVHSDVIDGDGGKTTKWTVRDSRLLGRVILADQSSGGGDGRRVDIDFARVEHDQRSVSGLILSSRAGPQSATRGVFGSLVDYHTWNYVASRREQIRDDATSATIVHDTADEWNDIPSRINVTETNVVRGTSGGSSGGSTTLVEPTAPSATPVVTTARGPLRTQMEKPRNQTIIVPNGIYTPTGTDFLAAANAPNTGANNGWLILKAETPYRAVVDLEGLELNFGPGVHKILFIGFRFMNGSIDRFGEKCYFWYTWFDWARANFEAQPLVGSNPYYTAMRIVDPRNQNRHEAIDDRFYGCTFDGARTPVTVGNTRDWKILGSRWKNSPGSFQAPFDSSTGHSDGISAQVRGCVDLEVGYCNIDQRVIIRDHLTGDLGDAIVSGLDIHDTWVLSADGLPFEFTAHDQGVFGSLRNIYCTRDPNSDDDVYRGEQPVGQGDYFIPPMSNLNKFPASINVTEENVVFGAPPAGATPPPDVWRAQWGYDDYQAFFSDPNNGPVIFTETPAANYVEAWLAANPYESHDEFFGTADVEEPPLIVTRKQTTGLAPGTILTQFSDAEMDLASLLLAQYGDVYRHDIRLSQVYAAGWRPGAADQAFWWTRYDNEFAYAKQAGCETVILCINDFGPYQVVGPPASHYPARTQTNIDIISEWVVDAYEHVKNFMGAGVKFLIEVMNEPNITLLVGGTNASVGDFAFWYDVIWDALKAHDSTLVIGPGAPAASDTVPLAGETTSNMFSRPSGGSRRYSPTDWYRNLFENTGNALGDNALKINGKFDCLFVHPYAHAQGRGVMDRVDNVNRPTAWPAPRTTLPVQMNYGQLRTVKEIWLLAVLAGNDPAKCICHGTETGFETWPYYDPAKTYVTNKRVFLTKGTIDEANRFVVKTQCYRATQNVPINTPPPNGTYWATDNNVIWHEEDLGAREITWYWDCWYGATTDPDGVNLGFVTYETANFGTYEGPITGCLTWYSPEDMEDPNLFHFGLVRDDGSPKGSNPNVAGHMKSLTDSAALEDLRATGTDPGTPQYTEPTVIGAVGATSAGGSISLTTPPDTQAGDALIVYLTTDDENATIPVPGGGWYNTVPHGNSGSHKAALLFNNAAVGGATQHTFNVPTGALAAALVVVRGMDPPPANFVGSAAYTNGTSTTTTHAITSATNNRPHSLFLVFFAANTANGGVTYTGPSGMQDLIGTQAKPAAGVSRPTVVAYAQPDIGTGATGSRTATASLASRFVGAHVLVWDEIEQPDEPFFNDWSEIGVTPIGVVQG